MAVALLRPSGSTSVVDIRSSHRFSSVSHVGSSPSRSSIPFFLQYRKFPSLHFQSPYFCGSICAASIAELNEDEPPANLERQKKQTPYNREKFKYPQRGNNQPEFPWRSAEPESPDAEGRSNLVPQRGNKSRYMKSRSSGYNQGNSQDPRSGFMQNHPPGSGSSRFNTDVPWDSKRRSNDDYRIDQGASTSRREGADGRAGNRQFGRSNAAPKPRGTSRYSQYDTGRDMHRAPWEQGPARAARASLKDRRLQRPEDQFLGNGGEEEAEEEVATYNKYSRSSLDNSRRRGRESAMTRIAEKLRDIQTDSISPRLELDHNRGRSPAETSSFFPRPGQLVLSGVDNRWSNSDHPLPKRVTDPEQNGDFSWDEDEDEDDIDDIENSHEKKKRVRPPSVAELTLPEDELKRLRGLAMMLRQRLKITKLGITPRVVDAIHNGWRASEIVRVKVDGPPALNMRKIHEELERLTGGLVIWRSGSAAVIYRGEDYVPPSVQQLQEKEEAERKQLLALVFDKEYEREDVTKEEKVVSNLEYSAESASVKVSGTEDGNTADIVKSDPELEMMENILEGLGPKYEDWTGNRPVPVDGDMLLSVSNSAFKRPFRFLPHGVKPNLSNPEMTELRRLARPISPHFVLGKNKGLNGLALAILKFWEKSEIVKIGVKRGVQNTNNERMAEELKRLTGGVLLARDKEYIVLYRGKDFLPPAVQAALEERDSMARNLQEEEEKIRVVGHSSAVQPIDGPSEPSKLGTLGETLEAKATWESWQNSEEQLKERIADRRAARARIAHRIEAKLNLAAQKMERAERELAKLDARMTPAGSSSDTEHISDEERYMFRKLGLKMRACLLLGRRGVFDGTVENMHLHWKHRELVKILFKGPLSEAQHTARMLEIESGGVLVGVVTTSKGQVIIVYRGRNYERPSELRPRHLLTKRQALKRSLEMQRKESLEKHILTLEKEINALQVGLNKMDKEDEKLLGSKRSRGESSAESMDDLEDFDNVEFELDGNFNEDTGDDNEFPMDQREEAKSRTVKLDPIFRAEPLARKDRLLLRQQALKLDKTAHFNVGKSNVVEGLAKSIRIYFKKHPLVKVGVKGRAKGTPVAEIVQQIEEETGAVLVSTEESKLIFYRGWPAGEQRPDKANEEEEEVPPELRATILKEEEVRDPTDYSYLTKEECALIGIEYEGNSEEEEQETEEERLVVEDDVGIKFWSEEEWDSDEDDEEWEGKDNKGEIKIEMENAVNAGFEEVGSEDDDTDIVIFEEKREATSQPASVMSLKEW